jgi:hypothetical protein
MALNDSPWRIPIFVTVVFSAIVAFNVGSIELLGQNFDQTARWIVIVGLALAFMISSREMGEMSNAELLSFLAPTVAILAKEFSTRFTELVEPFEPWYSVLMVGLVLLAYYALTNENI